MVLLKHPLVICCTFFIFQLSAQVPATQIVLNQAGFLTEGIKTAVIINAPGAGTFYILSKTGHDTLYKGTTGKAIQSKYSSANTKILRFDSFKQPGEYMLYVPGTGLSYPFKIGNNVFDNVAKASLKGFYYQRASMPLQERYAGIWAREEGHPDTAVFVHPSAASATRPANTIISTPGGWYDAGDYNKYIVNSGITMGTLMSAYEDFPVYFDALYTNIPESKNGIPDILNEVLYNLRWMLTMQDNSDGGVYHKCTNANFDAMIMPGAATAKRFVVQKGTAAALDFAAVMAQASRICKKFSKALPGLSDSCSKAAKLAWQWAITNPSVAYNQNEMNKKFAPPVVTGDYGDRNFEDEFFWAACELFIITKDKSYLPFIEKGAAVAATLPSWGNVGMLGCYTLLRFKSKLPAGINTLLSATAKKITNFADEMVLNGGNKAFATIIGQSEKDFIWGSNAVAMNESILLINAYLITQNKKYLNPALSNADYVLGRNATGYCFVTGIGSKPVMHPHHRPSVADHITDPVPGLMAGGPNPGRQDKCFYANTEIETSYTDDDCAYASNEIAINWNAPLVYVTNAINALQLIFKN